MAITLDGSTGIGTPDITSTAAPALVGTNFTSLPSAQLTGALPAISGASLTGIVGGETYDIQEFTASGTWSRPAGYLATDSVWVWVVGGGGGGGVDTSPNKATGGNGGVGIYHRWDADLLATTEPVFVGSGGGAGNGGDGADGGSSRFGISNRYGYINVNGGNVGRNNDIDPAQQYFNIWDTSRNFISFVYLTQNENPWYGQANDGEYAQNGMKTTIYGGGAGASGRVNNTSQMGGFSAWGGCGGGSGANGGDHGNGSFPGGGGGSNDSDFGVAGDGANGIVVVYTKRTIL